MILLDAERLSASRPNRPLFADVSITVSDGDRVGVVGINGCGKSTLLRMLGGELEPETGVVRVGRGARLGFLTQQPALPPGTVRDAVAGPDVADWQAETMLHQLGMAELLDASTDELSGGQAKRVALARLLVREHDVLILDEPTNHLDLDAIRFLEEWLAAFRGGLVLVTHDRHVLDRVTTKVLEIDRGRAYIHVPTGWHAGSGYAAYLAGRAEREAQAEAAEQTRRNLATRELAWLRRGAPARSTKPKARIATATALVEARPQQTARSGDLGLAAVRSTARLGSKGIEVRDVSFAWPDGTPVLAGITLEFEPGDRVGIVGPNGAGKTTLLELITGGLTPITGTVERGTTVRIASYDQLGAGLDPEQRVREAVAGKKGEPSLSDVTLMRRFWFDGDAQFAPIGTLSGGERRRLQLLLTLLTEPNVLLLDEPTNDLDLDTLRALEDFLDGWPGIVITVSHDRAFLDRVTDELLALDGDGTARWVRGGVAVWLAERDAAPVVSLSAPTKATTPARAAKPALKSSGGRSPSTLRRLLGQAERDVAAAVTSRDGLIAKLSTETDHVQLTALGEQLAKVQAKLEAAEESWLALADEAAAQGLEV